MIKPHPMYHPRNLSTATRSGLDSLHRPWPKTGKFPATPKIPAPQQVHRLTYRTRGAVLTLETSDQAFLETQRERLKGLPQRPAWIDGEALPESADEDKGSHSTAGIPVAEEAASRRPRMKLKVRKAPEPIVQADIDFDKLLQIAQEVRSSPHARLIQERILQGASSVDKLLLSAYFGEREFGSKGLSAAHLEAITKALGVGIPQREIYRLLMRYNALFGIENSLEVMHEGVPPQYRLTMQGLKKFRKVLKVSQADAPAFT